MSVAQPVEILDQYVATAPSPKNALDLFRGQWSSRLPAPLSDLSGGQARLFEDGRIARFEQEAGGFEGKTVLELGPLEAGHTYMLERGGASEIVAIEANTRAYLKCLVVKEILGLTRSRFLCGDFVEYLREPGPQFNLCVASGVLYHMRNPAELIGLLADRCRDHLLLWTHYFDQAAVDASPKLQSKLSTSEDSDYRGFHHTLHHYEYGPALQWAGFCGGSAHFANWMGREDILACLKYFGFGDVRIFDDARDHPNGPAFTLIARKQA